jgi:hypothetical protein
MAAKRETARRPRRAGGGEKVKNPKPEIQRPHSQRDTRAQARFDSAVRISDFQPRAGIAGYLLMEALVYIGLVFLLLAIGSAALYRCIDNSVALRRNADDIVRAVQAGELWRADIRAATKGVAWNRDSPEPVLRLQARAGEVDYRYTTNALFRRVDTGSWSRILDQVKASTMERDPRPNVTAWRWELELQPKARGSFKPGRLRPLFTFLAVPPAPVAP